MASLTELTTAGGCAAKYSAARLEQLLQGFLPADSADLLVGLSPADDAAVYRLDADRAIVFTLDFFPPIVDDPDDFGAIAAANALNDVFAMGGSPLLALSIAAFPEELETGTVAAVFAAAERQVREAGAILAGGHTIRDDEPKYGLAVVGTVHPEALWPKAGARPGDAVFLTKPLGTALVLGGHRKGLVGDAERNAAIDWMRTLNRDAADLLRPFEPSCVTDVTGFGLLGHGHEVAERSGVRIVLEAGRIPAMDGALAASLAGIRNAGHPRNEEFAGPSVTVEAGVGEELVGLAYDPQTSGGLLVTLPAAKGVGLEAEFAARGLFLRRVGRVEDGAGVLLAV